MLYKVAQQLGYVGSNWSDPRPLYDATYGHIWSGLKSMLENSLATYGLTVDINNDMTSAASEHATSS
jgi:hypothetical protein